MSVESTSLSSVSFFCEKPNYLNLGTQGNFTESKYSSSKKIGTLIEELKERGPFVAVGKLGPDTYVEAPFKLKKPTHYQEIYGWTPGSKQKGDIFHWVIVLGAQKKGKQRRVYFTMCRSITPPDSLFPQMYQPSKNDHKIYTCSHKTFKKQLSNAFQPRVYKYTTSAQLPSIACFSSAPQVKPVLSDAEKRYVEELTSIQPLDSIFDRGPVEARCKAIGQEVFDLFKGQNNGSSKAGKEAAQRVCNSVHYSAGDGRLRKQYIERVWQGIGDDNWRWMP